MNKKLKTFIEKMKFRERIYWNRFVRMKKIVNFIKNWQISFYQKRKFKNFRNSHNGMRRSKDMLFQSFNLLPNL